jgi:hypothetical protein
MHKAQVARFRLTREEKDKLHLIGKHFGGGYSEYLRRVIESVEVNGLASAEDECTTLSQSLTAVGQA